MREFERKSRNQQAVRELTSVIKKLFAIAANIENSWSCRARENSKPSLSTLESVRARIYHLDPSWTLKIQCQSACSNI